VPAEAGWIVKRNAADPTSGSLRVMEARANGFGGARSSCPRKRDGLSNVIQRTRQAGPSERWKRVQTDSEGHACRARGIGMDYQT
jgi:hypothetical protein